MGKTCENPQPRLREDAVLRALRRQLLYRRVRKGFVEHGRYVRLGTRPHSRCVNRVGLNHAVSPPKLEHPGLIVPTLPLPTAADDLGESLLDRLHGQLSVSAPFSGSPRYGGTYA